MDVVSLASLVRSSHAYASTGLKFNPMPLRARPAVAALEIFRKSLRVSFIVFLLSLDKPLRKPTGTHHTDDSVKKPR
jgi:hypothetical protein